MPTYNPNDFYPHSGQEINSAGNVVNPADSVDQNGNQGVSINGRKVSQQRVLASLSIAANGNISTVVNLGLGTKSINAVYKCTANAYLALYPCDKDGNPLTLGNTYGNTSTGGNAQGVLVLSELGGAQYVSVYIFDKSAAANTCNFVDLTWTFD